MRVLPPIALVLACGVASCAKPDQQVLADCHSEAAQKGKHHGLTNTDLGELTEACMARKGYLLNKNGEACSHDLPSQKANRCYYPDTWWARAYHRFI